MSAEWIKLSDIVWPEDHTILNGAQCAIIHVNETGELYEEPRIARFNMELGFFIAEDETGSYAINSNYSRGEIYFLRLPKLEVGGKLLC